MRDRITRRAMLAMSGAAGWAAAAPGTFAAADASVPTRPIPSSDEPVPAIGLGSWITFNVGDDPVLRDECAAVMRAFFAAGGRMIDSSPMYGSSQAVIGYGLDKLGRTREAFSTDKGWTRDGDAGPDQIATSAGHWGVSRFDLLQVHNLVAWRDHLALLFEMKARGRLRYVGVTTSHGRRGDELEQIMRFEPLDFVQLTYNPVDRHAEQRLLPLAAERGIAVIVNRPFRGGSLPERLAGSPLPGVAKELGATTWAQLILKFILAHPAVTCPIPATTRVAHVRENLDAAHGALPDTGMRSAIARVIADRL